MLIFLTNCVKEYQHVDISSSTHLTGL